MCCHSLSVLQSNQASFFSSNEVHTHNLRRLICMNVFEGICEIMLRNSQQQLKIESPSNTTVCYTVSDGRHPSSSSSSILQVLGHAARIIFCLFVFTINAAIWDKSSIFPAGWSSSFDMESSMVGRMISRLANVTDWRIVTAASLIILYVCLRRGSTGKRSGDY